MLVVIFILGLAVGSFLNAYIFRTMPSPLPLPRGEGGRRPGKGSVWRGRSYCPKCRKPLRWYELIPLLSFFVQLGRCRGCQQKIDWQYPLVELATGVLFAANYELGIRNYGLIHDSLFLIHQMVGWYFLAALIILFVYDLRFGLVPDRVVLPAIAVAALYTVILSVSEGSHTFCMGSACNLYSVRFLASLGMTIGSVAVGALFFAIQYWISRGRWLGAGDIRIGALMGAILGWPYIVEGLVLSYLVGGTVGLGLLISRRKKFGQTLPLGTFLTFGAAVTFLYGEAIWKWYWNI